MYNRPSLLGSGEYWQYSETAVLGGSITYKNPIWDLKWAAVLGGAVLGGAVLGGAVLGRLYLFLTFVRRIYRINMDYQVSAVFY